MTIGPVTAADATAPRPPAAETGIEVYRATDTQAQAAEDYWTPERMRAATPIDDTFADPRSTATTEPMSAALPKSRLHRMGKIFYHFGGHSFSCSGTIVTSHGRDSILTAGHCLRQIGGTEVGNLLTVFVPGYGSGPDMTPYGKWGVRSWHVPGRWIDLLGRSNPSYDYGVIQVKQHKNGRIQDVLGADNYKLSAGWQNEVYLIGYPSKYNYPVLCHAVTSKKDIKGHKSAYKFYCNDYSDGVSGSGLLLAHGDNWITGEGTIIGVLGGHHQGGDPKKDGNASFATRLDKDFQKFWLANSK
ncbi:hypothetical protein [Actinoallomurus sp. NPDC052274]|uniref:trypsin-like serine peptidase n=1 Tax=Actinoallomurus sp. NPDC052274 TaxID=3155420 RepID=UPI003416A9D8